MNPADSYRDHISSSSIACSIGSTIDNYQAIRLYLCLSLVNKNVTKYNMHLMHDAVLLCIVDRSQIITTTLIGSQLQHQALIGTVYSLNNCRPKYSAQYNRSMHHGTTAYCIPMIVQTNHIQNMWDRTRTFIDQRSSQ